MRRQRPLVLPGTYRLGKSGEAARRQRDGRQVPTLHPPRPPSGQSCPPSGRGPFTFMPTLRLGSLFSGIGGLELGLERTGMRTVFQVESNPYALAVLAKHWPDVPRFDDVNDVHGVRDCPRGLLDVLGCPRCLPECDVLCGGFPCQDISHAGEGDGIDGARSGLWREFARLVRELRPSYVVVENVPALTCSRVWTRSRRPGL